MERHERALQARASRRIMEPMAPATNYYSPSTAYCQSAPVRQSVGVPSDYATVQPPQRQATVCSCCSGLHPAETSRFRYAICNYCLQEAHIERACDLKQRALTFRMSRQTAEPADRFDGLAPQNQPSNTSWRGGRNWHNARGRRGGRGGARANFVYNPVTAYPSPLEVPILVDSQTIYFELDTGATLSLLAQSTFERL